jgi:hypothetical protein
MIIENISDLLDKLKRYTEKNSPYYGMDANLLTPAQQQEHQRYIMGGDTKAYWKSIKEFNKQMEESHRDYLNKSAGSSIGAADCWVDKASLK